MTWQWDSCEACGHFSTFFFLNVYEMAEMFLLDVCLGLKAKVGTIVVHGGVNLHKTQPLGDHDGRTTCEILKREES